MNHIKILLLVLSLSVSYSLSHVAAAPVIHDNFNLSDGTPSKNWHVASGKWRIKNNKLVVDSTDADAFIFFGSNHWQNYIVEVDATFSKVNNPLRWCSIIFRGDTSGTAPFSQCPLRFAATRKNGIEFAVKTPGKWHVRRTASASANCLIGIPRKLKVVVKGTEVLFYLDANLLIASSYCVDRPTGCVGLGASGCIVEFDNFKVTRTPDTPLPIAGKYAKCSIISHRGLSADAPENTLASICKSAAIGVEACEFDVRCTKDGFVVLVHDATVTRTTNGTGKVADMTFADIRTLDAGSWIASTYADQTVPVIDEALNLLNVSNQTAVIDIKDPASVSEIVRLAEKKSMTDRVVILSSSQNVLDRVASLNRNIKRAWLCYDFPKTAITPAKQATWLTDTAMKFDVQIVNVNYMLLSPKIIKHLHKRNIKVWTWTVNHPEIIKHLLNWQVDAITTDKPAMLKTIRDTK
ncbi:MAG: hypothetical protein K9M75_03390 [Phycisphaerae bacterium]|nr:hypothetical protein [Phycisphaerae bacterium]